MLGRHDPGCKLPAQAGRDARIDILRGIALLMIFVDHSSGNVFSYGSIATWQLSDAAEIFFLLSGFSCMAAYGHRLDRDDLAGVARQIGGRCLRLYIAQISLLVAAEALVLAWGHRGGISPDALNQLRAVHGWRLGLASSELFQVDGLRAFGTMASLLGEPAFFDVLRSYIVLLGCFPLMMSGLRRAPGMIFIVSITIWFAAHGANGLHFVDHLQGEPWAFNPFGWQFIFLCGAGLRSVIETRGRLPRTRTLIIASLGIVLVAFLIRLGSYSGLTLPQALVGPQVGKVNLSPIRLLNSLAMIYLALVAAWPRWCLALPGFRALRLCGRHSLLIFSLGVLMSLNVDLSFLRFGQGLLVQIPATLGGGMLLVAAAMVAEARRLKIEIGRSRPALRIIGQEAS